MSGGERKKRISQGTGWEEAGAEFYQESYPGGDIDLEALPRDPHYFATLLPSKQTRAATTRRPRAENKATIKRRTSTRSRNRTNTMGQNTMNNDIHVAMMPDLSENLANEETTWEEMMLIKTMPIPMAQKKEIKAKLLSADTFRLQGLKQFKWKRRKLYEHLRIKKIEFYKIIELWRKCFIKIEGNCGNGVVSYFGFVRWLMLLNLAMTAVLFIFIVLPTLLMNHIDIDPCISLNDTLLSDCCISLFQKTWANESFNPYSLIEGNGWLASTVMFYGVYPNSVLESKILNYNLPIAYIVALIFMYAFGLYVMMLAAAEGFKNRVVESEGQYYKYCSMIFAGWDFSIYNESSARIKHQALYNEITSSLETERRVDDKKNRSREENFRIMSVRCFVNSVVLLIIISACILIFFTFQFSIDELQKDIDDDPYRLFLEFSPYMCSNVLNLIIPKILSYFVSLECYNPLFAHRITFIRAVLLRFSTLGVLIASMYSMIRCSDNRSEHIGVCPNASCRKPLCWETYIGQQVYKLLLMDIISHGAITFFIDFPRMLLAKHLNCKLARTIGAQEFELPRHALDAVYSQTLVWFGSFYAPLLPAVGTLLFFFMFYIKKFSCLVNSSPSTTIFRGSRSQSMFMFLLLISFFVAVIPWAYTILEMEPSKLCGPFRGRTSTWSVVVEVYQSFPVWLTYSLESLLSPTFAVPTFFILLLTLQYFYIIYQANKQMVDVLKKQLVLEGHDKQFLLNRLSAFIKQHQERHKAIRSVDPPVNSN